MSLLQPLLPKLPKPPLQVLSGHVSLCVCWSSYVCLVSHFCKVSSTLLWPGGPEFSALFNTLLGTGGRTGDGKCATHSLLPSKFYNHSFKSVGLKGDETSPCVWAVWPVGFSSVNIGAWPPCQMLAWLTIFGCLEKQLGHNWVSKIFLEWRMGGCQSLGAVMGGLSHQHDWAVIC